MIAETLFGRSERAATKWTTGHPMMDRALGWLLPPTVSGVEVTDHVALTYSAVWAATRLLSSTAAAMPLTLYRKLPNGGAEPATTHPLFDLLHYAPNGDMSSFSFRQEQFQLQINAGSCYAEIERTGGGAVVALHPIHSSRIERKRIDQFGRESEKGRIVYLIHGSEVTPIDDSDMLHIKSTMGGKGVIAAARESIGFGLAAERYGSSFFGNGAVPPIVITHPTKMNKEARANFRQEWKDIHQGPTKQQEVAVLWEGMDLKAIGINGKDSQFLESRQHQVEEIARWYGVPPHMIGDLRRSTNNNIEHQGIEFVQYSLIPWLASWEQEIYRKLLTKQERSLYFAKFVVDGLLRGDVAARSEALKIQFERGAITLDEWRALENRNPLDDDMGKKHFMMVNMTTVDRVIDGTAGGEAPAQLASLPPADTAALPQRDVTTSDVNIATATPPVTEKAVTPGLHDGTLSELLDTLKQMKVALDADAAREAARMEKRSTREREKALRVVTETMQRLVGMEVKAVAESSKHPSEFIGRVEKFYAAHRPRMIEALRTPLESLLELQDSELIEGELAFSVARHVETSMDMLFPAAECQPEELADRVAECVGRWAEDRTNIDLGAIECLA